MQFEPLGKPNAAGAELHAADARLQELDRLEEDFVSTVSHELRSPLTSIRAFAEILLSEPDLDVEQRQHFLQIVVNESERLTRVTNDVLVLARIESERIGSNMQPTDLRQLIEDAVSSVFQRYQKRGIELHKDLPGEPVITDD